MHRPRRRLVLIVAATAGLGLVALPAVRVWWSVHSSNPVRRGLALAEDLGCFSCHGLQGTGGPGDPGLGGTEVPAWSGGVWMMYVESSAEAREFILDGVSQRRAASQSARDEREKATLRMPAYRDLVDDEEVEALTAAFMALSAMILPASDSAAGRGRRLARDRGCGSCHGPAGSGGRPNPRSFTGFIPGWYGTDFEDLVRDRAEFDEWIRTGSLERLARWPASWFLGRQTISMPAYPELSPAELDDLWAYVSWLSESGGGVSSISHGS